MSALPSSRIDANADGAKKASWKDYGIRFLFGGVITAVVGIVGVLFGPVIAGLFLAFPAILPASLTLIAQHTGDHRAGDDASGAALGSIGLMAFGAVVWLMASRTEAWMVLACAAIAWLAVSVTCWGIYCTVRQRP